MLVNRLIAKLFLNTDLQRQPGGPNVCLTVPAVYKPKHKQESDLIVGSVSEVGSQICTMIASRGCLYHLRPATYIIR